MSVRALRAGSAAGIAASPLSRSPQLLNISEQAATLARLYGRGALRRTIDNTRWRFRWRCISTPLTGVEVRLRIGRAEVAVLLEDLGPFGAAIDVTRAGLPAELRAAYLNGLGAALWPEIEALTQRAVEVLEVQPQSTMGLTPDCIGFEVGLDPNGAATRGLLRPIHSDLDDILAEVSRREMPAVALPPGLRIRWAAVVGSTGLTAGEVRALEEQDIVVIEQAVYAADGLACSLGAGPKRHYAGRAMLRRGGQLQIIQFTTKGQATMTHSNADAALPEETDFDDIPVSLRFELAHWDASLADVANLAAGSIIDLGQRVDEQSVSVWVEQRCIGTGQLVAIGERLGVRLLSVFAGGTLREPKPSTEIAAERGT
jgi:type III secretion protein Q